MTIQRIDQVVSQRTTNDSEALIATPVSTPRAAIAAQPNAAWQRLTPSAGQATSAALSRPAATGAGLRTAESRSSSERRVAIANAEAQLSARRAIAEAALADVDEATKGALEPIFAAELADYTRQLEALRG